MRKSLVFILMFMFLIPTVSSIAFAEEKTFPEFAACTEAIDENTGIASFLKAMTNCNQEEYERQKARMDIAYNKLLQKLTSKEAFDEVDEKTNTERVAGLVNSQQGWVRYAEEYCNLLYGGPYDGFQAGLDSISWLRAATAERADDLESYLEQNY